jgi:hypothetical protein
MRFRHLASLALAGALLAACSQTPAPEQTFQVTPVPATPGSLPFVVTPEPGAYPSPGAAPGGYPAPGGATSAYPAPTVAAPSDATGRAQTALEALPLAQQAAREQFSPEATLYSIIPSQVMLRNLSGPPVLPGWFFKFRTAGSPREFIVQVVNGQLSGAIEIEPIEQPTPLEQAIPLDRVTVDSDDVFTTFQERAPSLNITVEDPKRFDLELVNLEGSSAPVWSVFDPMTETWIFSVDATTGEEVGNPRG